MVIFSTILIIFYLPLGLGWQAMLAIITLGYGAKIGWQYGLLRGQHAITGLMLDDSGWWLQTREGLHPANLCGDSTVTLAVCILRFKITFLSQKQTCLVFPDSLPADAYRRLIVQVRTNTALRAEQMRRHTQQSRVVDV